MHPYCAGYYSVGVPKLEILTTWRVGWADREISRTRAQVAGRNKDGVGRPGHNLNEDGPLSPLNSKSSNGI